MPDERSPAQLSPEATYRAIGRYVYEFSQLVAHMRDAMTRHLDRSNGGVAAIAFAEAQPRQIANAFFTMCRTVTHLDPAEEKTGARIGTRVGEAIEMRENVAAGDWWVGASSLGAEAVKRSATDLDRRSDTLADLTNTIAEYGAICLHLPPYDSGEHHVGDYLVLRAGEAVREGPRALETPRVFYAPALPAELAEAPEPIAALRQPVIEAEAVVEVEAEHLAPAPSEPAPPPVPAGVPEPPRAAPREPAGPPPERRAFRVRLRADLGTVRSALRAAERADQRRAVGPMASGGLPAWLTHERLRRGMLAIAGLTAVLLSLLAYAGHVFGPQEAATLATRFSIRGTQPVPSGIVLVTIDQQTVGNAKMPLWPFPRKYEANVINFLHAAGAKAIGVDIQFTSQTDTTDDNDLINAVAKAHGVVLSDSDVTSSGGTGVFGQPASTLRRVIDAFVGNAYVSDDPSTNVTTVAYAPDHVKTFAVLLAERVLHHTLPSKDFPGGSALVDFVGPPGTFHSQSFVSVCRRPLPGCTGSVPASIFRGKIVLIGATAYALHDQHTTPVGPTMSGVEYWANALWSILRGNPLRGASGAINVLAIVLMTLVMPLIVLRLRPGLILVGFALAIGAVYLAVAQIEFDGNALLPVVYPIVGLVLGTVEAGSADLWAERIARRHLEVYKTAYEALPSNEGAAFFVSYRRDQSSWPARILHDEFVRRFGEDSVFKDSDSIQAGQTWPERLGAAIADAGVVLVVIGPQWADARDRNGARRLEDPQDWVRLEVEKALASEKAQVVPVLVDGATMPAASVLPESLRPLTEHQAFALTVEKWSSDLDALIASIQSGRIRDFLRNQRAADELSRP